MKTKKAMTAKGILAWIIVSGVILVVAAFLAMHSINLFTFVFPIDQQQWAWMGFGLTGGGAVGYLVLFLWLAQTKLQKVISFSMMIICAIGEVLAAIFGMQIEGWKKSGWELAQGDVQTMLMVIGILAILHFFALIAHFAGDKIIEMFGDEDGDGIPNYADDDYKATKPDQRRPSHQPVNGKKPQIHTYNLPDFLKAIKMDGDAFRAFLIETDTVTMAWQVLRDDGILPIDITHRNFNELAMQVMGQKANP